MLNYEIADSAKLMQNRGEAQRRFAPFCILHSAFIIKQI